MKERVKPSPEAIERIRKVGEREILKFFDEVSLGSLRNLSEHLPTVHGFRPRSEAGIRQQKTSLAKRIANRTGGAERDHLALYAIWRAWAWEKLGDADAVEHILDALEKGTSSFRSSEESAAESNRAASLAFVEALKELSAEHKCSRELIERLLSFSPLTIDDAMQKVVAACKSAKEIERDATIINLPDRLREDEQVIQKLKARVDSLEADINKILDTTKELIEANAHHTNEISRIAELIAALKEERLEADNTKAIQNDELKKHASQLQELEARVTAAFAENDETVELLSAMVTPVEEKLRALQDAIEKSSQSAQADANIVATLTDGLARLGEQVAELSSKSTIDEMGSAIRGLAASSGSSPVTSPMQTQATGLLLPINTLPHEHIRSAGQQQPKNLSSADDIVTVLAAGLQSIGLKKSSAKTLAEEISAAALTGQVSFFKGALAADVARICSIVMSDGHGTLISIPIGLAHGESLASTIAAQTATDVEVARSFVLEGVNRSALDALKDVLLKFQMRRLGPDQRPAFYFATAVSGIAALPIEPEHLEIGPVFDLDYLDWKMSTEVDPSFEGGVVSFEVVSSLRTKLSNGAGDDLDEALRVLRQFVRKRNPLIERNVARAFIAVSAIRGVSPDVSPLQSLAFGWLMPLWIALGITKESIDSEIDGGKCDASTADTRLAAMLATEKFGDTSVEGGS